MGAFEAVLFDFGHTLFHPGRITLGDLEVGSSSDEEQRAFDASLEEAWQRSREPEEIAKGRDLSAEAHLRCWLELLSPLNHLSPGLAEATYDFMCSPRGWEPYPDTREVLLELERRCIRVGIVSDCGWDIRDVVVRHGMERLIASYDLSYELGVCKPAIEIFESACNKLSVDPGRALMVGDTWITDGGAAALGITTVILPNRDRVAHPALRTILGLVG